MQSDTTKPQFGEVDDKIDDFLAVLEVFLDALALKTCQQLSFIGFDPCSEAMIKDSTGNEFKVSKGMPPVIFQLAGITKADLVKAQKIVSDYASKGYRTLAAAREHEGSKWMMLGTVPMFDRRRPTCSSDHTADALAQDGRPCARLQLQNRW